MLVYRIWWNWSDHTHAGMTLEWNGEMEVELRDLLRRAGGAHFFSFFLFLWLWEFVLFYSVLAVELFSIVWDESPMPRHHLSHQPRCCCSPDSFGYTSNLPESMRLYIHVCCEKPASHHMAVHRINISAVHWIAPFCLPELCGEHQICSHQCDHMYACV